MIEKISIKDPRIYPCLIPEEKALSFKRSTCKISKNKGKIDFLIDAEDKIALKATKFSVKNLIAVYNKTKEAIQDGF